MSILTEKFKSVLFSVLPITAIVYILNFTAAPVPTATLLRFTVGAALIVLGLTIFLTGVDIGITPLGNHIGSALSKSNKVWVIVLFGLIVGFFISVAEPDLQILGEQIADATGGALPQMLTVTVVSVGIAVMLVCGFIRILYNMPLYKLLAAIYCLIFILALFVSPQVLAISFDASGATTGALTVPFILALAIGVSSMKKDSKAGEKDSFGLVAITSTGAILAVMLMGLGGVNVTGAAQDDSAAQVAEGFLGPFLEHLPRLSLEAVIAIAPLFVIFIVLQIFMFKFHRRQVRRITKGLIYTCVGLILFLSGVNTGFLETGTLMGEEIAVGNGDAVAVFVGFVLGLVTILAEPAVYVLTRQVEEVTSGYVKRKTILAALALGVGAAVALSILRIVVPEIKLWHYLLPGYIISIALSFFVPKLFVGIAFDSGGVASGPMTATFILAFSKGVARSASGADVLTDAFGMIALVAMTPIITLQLLGLIYKLMSKKNIVAPEDGDDV